MQDTQAAKVTLIKLDVDAKVANGPIEESDDRTITP